MSEPIPEIPEVPADVVAARLLPALVELLYTDPLARPMVVTKGYSSTWYYVQNGALEISCHEDRTGSEQLAAAQALFGGTVEPGTSYGLTETHVLITTWRGVPLKVRVEIRREDEVAELRKQLAALQAAAGQGVAE